jgi:hypothetical protein
MKPAIRSNTEIFKNEESMNEKRAHSCRNGTLFWDREGFLSALSPVLGEINSHMDFYRQVKNALARSLRDVAGRIISHIIQH